MNGHKDANSRSVYYTLHIGECKNNENDVIKSFEEQRKLQKKNFATISTDSLPLDKLYDFVKAQTELFNISDKTKLLNISTLINVSSKRLVWQNNEFSNFKGLFFMGLEGLSGDLKADQASGKVTWYRDTETIDLDFSKLELKQIFSAEKSLSSNFAGNNIDTPITLNFKVDEFTNKFGTLEKINLSMF